MAEVVPVSKKQPEIRSALAMEVKEETAGDPNQTSYCITIMPTKVASYFYTTPKQTLILLLWGIRYNYNR